mmetsp:Transcript_30193/g.72977  ORF Transcript_30193/g.72977 Transcript_30193/m.72977 type:complete len:89 (-) Transcript_30193:1635-1901(-)
MVGMIAVTIPARIWGTVRGAEEADEDSEDDDLGEHEDDLLEDANGDSNNLHCSSGGSNSQPMHHHHHVRIGYTIVCLSGDRSATSHVP